MLVFRLSKSFLRLAAMQTHFLFLYRPRGQFHPVQVSKCREGPSCLRKVRQGHIFVEYARDEGSLAMFMHG